MPIFRGDFAAVGASAVRPCPGPCPTARSGSLFIADFGKLPQYQGLLLEDILKQLDRPFIAGLPEPKDRLLSHGRILMCLCDPYQYGNHFIFWPLAESKNRLLLYFSILVSAVYDVSEDFEASFTCLLTQPKDRGLPYLLVGFCASQFDQERQALFGLPVDANPKHNLLL